MKAAELSRNGPQSAACPAGRWPHRGRRRRREPARGHRPRLLQGGFDCRGDLDELPGIDLRAHAHRGHARQGVDREERAALVRRDGEDPGGLDLDRAHLGLGARELVHALGEVFGGVELGRRRHIAEELRRPEALVPLERYLAGHGLRQGGAVQKRADVSTDTLALDPGTQRRLARAREREDKGEEKARLPPAQDVADVDEHAGKVRGAKPGVLHPVVDRDRCSEVLADLLLDRGADLAGVLVPEDKVVHGRPPHPVTGERCRWALRFARRGSGKHRRPSNRGT